MSRIDFLMRLLVLAAGPGANYLTASIVAIAIFLAYGKPSSMTSVEEVVGESAAQAAGLRVGDVLVAANGKPVSVHAPISAVVRASKGAELMVTVRREGRTLDIPVTPRRDPKSGDLMIGIRIGQLREAVPVDSEDLQAIVGSVDGKEIVSVGGECQRADLTAFKQGV
jgi:regulator of sigma E protease